MTFDSDGEHPPLRDGEATPAMGGPDPAAIEARAVAVFAAVVDLDPAAREVQLTERCGGDAVLLSAVTQLLRHYDDPSPVLQALLQEQTDIARDGQPRPGKVATIGGYEIVATLGRGGMGTVYRALQNKPRRSVALKVLSPVTGGIESVARFEREIEVLGMLQHPGICRIHDAGAVDLGLGLGEVLWFAMELVDGLPITEFARRHALDVAARCALVAQIGDAVQHAHHRGVVHRDLKPSNVLVVGAEAGATQPQAKVLDFGIARWRDTDVTTAAARTRTGAILGTLQYMSPEQLGGDPAAVDGRTDVYAMGVILYELLAGRPPLALDDRSLTEACRIVQEREPASIGRIDRRLRGDLETIASKAMAKHREDRYASAAELSADLGRYLRGEPIVARTPSTFDQVRRFARRHRTLVGSVVAVMIALLAGLVAVAILAIDNEALATREAAARTEAQTTSERLRRELYSAQMRLCGVAFTSGGGVARARAVLPAWQAPAADDLRGFEWYLLHSMCHQAELVHPCDPRPYDLRWTTDAGVLFSAHWYGAVLTDARTGDIIERFPAAVSPLSFAAMTPDRTLLVQSVSPTRIVATDLARRVELATFDHDGEVLRCALSPDGSLLAVNVEDQAVVVWEVRSGRRLAVLGSVQSAGIAFSGDGAWLATSDKDVAAVVWRTGAWQAPAQRMQGPMDYAMDLDFDAAGAALATCGSSGWLRIYDCRSGRETASRLHQHGLRRVAFAPRGDRVAVACEDYAAYVYDLANGTVRTFDGHAGIVTGVTWSPDGDKLATMSDDHTLRVWRLATPAPVRTVAVPPVPSKSSSDCQLAFAADGASLAIHLVSVVHKTWAVETAVVSDGFALEAGGGYRVRVEDRDAISVTNTSTGADARARILASAPGRLAASATTPRLAVGMRGSLRIWDLASPSAPQLVTTTDVCRELAWQRDGTSLAFVDGSDTVQVFDTLQGKVVAAHGFAEGALALACAPLDDTIAVACVDQVVRLWSPTRGPLSTLAGHAAHVTTVAYSPDGCRLASGSRDCTVKIWDVASGAELLSLPHEHFVGAVAWSGSGQRLASMDVNGCVKLWDATSAWAQVR